MFMTLLNFEESSATKCVSLNNKPCIARRNFNDLTPIELNYYQFMIIPGRCNGSCNILHDSSVKT